MLASRANGSFHRPAVAAAPARARQRSAVLTLRCRRHGLRPRRNGLGFMSSDTTICWGCSWPSEGTLG